MTVGSERGESTDDSFAIFYAAEFDLLVRLAFLLVGTSHDAEELAQETLSRVQPGFSGLNAPHAYARTVLVNLVKRHRRGVARRRHAERTAAAEGPRDAETNDLWDVIAALPDRQRTVIVLRYYEDLTESEIATTMGCRPGTVKSLCSRALARLRHQIGES